MSTMRLAKVAVAVLALVALLATSAQATLMFDLRATAVNDIATSEQKNVTLNTGDIVTLSLYVTALGANDVGATPNWTDDSLQSASCGLIGTVVGHSVVGQFLAVSQSPGSHYYQSPFNTSAYDGTAVNLDGDTYNESIASSTLNHAAALGWFYPRAGSSQQSVAPGSFLVGVFKWQVMATAPGSPASTIAVLPRHSATDATKTNNSQWMEDGVSYGGSTGGAFDPGTPLTLNAIPEPSSIMLLCVGAVALFLVRRKMR